MTEVYLKKNTEGRFDCYNALTDEYESTLTCGSPFILIPDDEDDCDELEIPGRIEHNSIFDYYWIDTDEFTRQKLTNGMRGFI